MLCHVSNKCVRNVGCNRYQPSGLLWNPGQYPSDAAGYDNKVATLRQWVITRLAWLESQFAMVSASRLS